MQIQCPNCRQTIAAENVNLSTGLAKCLNCNEIFAFAGQVGGDAPQPDLAEVPIPHDLNMQYDGNTLVLSWRWFNLSHVFMLFFCLAWDSFLIFWYTIGLSGGLQGGFDLIFFIFPLGHVAVGIGLTWSTLAGFFNRTVIRASFQELSIKHHPIWMPGQKQVATSDVSQLFCREHVTRSRNGPSVSYELNAMLKSGAEVKLVRLSRPEQARFIEQRIEGHLGIQNRKVAGEMN